MRRVTALSFCVCVTAGTAGRLEAQAVAGQGDAVAANRLDTIAQEWLGRAESGDLIPAWNLQEPPTGIPKAYRVGPPIIKETTRRCRFHYEKDRRSLLLCLEVFGAYHREDTPRAQLKVSTAPPAMPTARPPVARIEVK